MRILSDNVATKDQMTAVDEKQSAEIVSLKIWLACSFFTNALFTTFVYFTR